LSHLKGILYSKHDSSLFLFGNVRAPLTHDFLPSLIHELGLPPEIGNAYAVLSNPDKRRQYDLTGGEEPSSPGHSQGGGGGGGFDFHRGFEADITPEDLFNMFFGGGFPSCK